MATTTTSGRRIALWAGGSLLAAALAFVAFRPRPVPVDVATITRGDLQVTVDHEGMSRVRERYVVSAPVAGRVLRIELNPGDAVVAGKTVIATFLPGAPPLLDARARAGAEARVLAADAGVTEARAAQAQAEAQRELADRQRDRTAELLRKGVAAGAEFDAADSDARSKTEASTGAAAAVVAARHELDAARAALLETSTAGTPAAKTLAIHSPVNGVVLQRLHESEAVVAAGEPLVVLADPADLEIAADYLSSEAVQIHAGMHALIDRWGGNQLLHGRVRRVEPAGFLKVSALGVDEQRVNVIIALDDSRRVWQSLGDGYRVEVRVVLWEQPNVLKVPTSALFRQGSDWAVFVLQSGRATLRTVSLGERTGVDAQVVTGLAEGDRVLVHPSDAVGDGVRVAPRG